MLIYNSWIDYIAHECDHIYITAVGTLGKYVYVRIASNTLYNNTFSLFQERFPQKSKNSVELLFYRNLEKKRIQQEYDSCLEIQVDMLILDAYVQYIHHKLSKTNRTWVQEYHNLIADWFSGYTLNDTLLRSHISYSYTTTKMNIFFHINMYM